MSDVAVYIANISTSVGVILAALAALLPKLSKLKADILNVKDVANGVHTIVNQQRTDMETYIRQLTDALNQAGIHVPTNATVSPLAPKE